MRLNDLLQWSGAILIVAGHSFNAIGPAMYPWNIVVFFVGTIMFLLWALRVRNSPQMVVNAVSILIGATGLIKAFG